MTKSQQELVAEQDRLIAMHGQVQDQLLRYPGVDHVGVGVKETGGRLTDTLCYRVYVKEKLPKDRLRPGALLPRKLMGVPLDVLEKGAVLLTANPDTQKYVSLRGGVQIRNEFFEEDNTVGAGTIGCLARRVSDNKLVGLSAKHVLLDGLTGNPLPSGVGTEVGHPRWIKCSCCCSYNEIGEVLLTDGALDCGIVALDNDAIAQVAINGQENKIEDIGTIAGVAQAVCYEVVRKRGAATRLTSGVIVDVLFDGSKILVNPCIGYDNFNEPGDSGAVIVNSANKVVGLLVGASRTEANKGVGLHIKPVLAALGIKIAGQDSSTAGLVGVPASSCTGTPTTCSGGPGFPLSTSGAYFRALDDGTLFIQQQPGYSSSSTMQQRFSDIFMTVVPALQLRVFANGTVSQSWEERARYNAIPTPFLVTTGTPLHDAITRLSTYQLDLMRQHFPGSTPNSINVDKVRISFERFMNGELRERPTTGHPYGAAAELVDGPREPNGSFEMMFAAFAWLAIENNIDAAEWTPLYNAMVQCQELFMCVYRWRPQSAPPASSIPIPAFTSTTPRNPLSPLPGSSGNVKPGESGFGDQGFSFDHFHLTSASDIPTVVANLSSSTSIAQSDETRKIYLRAKYAAFDYAQTKNAMKENIQRMLYMP